MDDLGDVNGYVKGHRGVPGPLGPSLKVSLGCKLVCHNWYP